MARRKSRGSETCPSHGNVSPQDVCAQRYRRLFGKLISSCAPSSDSDNFPILFSAYFRRFILYSLSLFTDLLFWLMLRHQGCSFEGTMFFLSLASDLDVEVTLVESETFRPPLMIVPFFLCLFGELRVDLIGKCFSNRNSFSEFHVLGFFQKVATGALVRG